MGNLSFLWRIDMDHFIYKEKKREIKKKKTFHNVIASELIDSVETNMSTQRTIWVVLVTQKLFR